MKYYTFSLSHGDRIKINDLELMRNFVWTSVLLQVTIVMLFEKLILVYVLCIHSMFLRKNNRTEYEHLFVLPKKKQQERQIRRYTKSMYNVNHTAYILVCIISIWHLFNNILHLSHLGRNGFSIRYQNYWPKLPLDLGK